MANTLGKMQHRAVVYSGDLPIFPGFQPPPFSFQENWDGFGPVLHLAHGRR